MKQPAWTRAQEEIFQDFCQQEGVKESTMHQWRTYAQMLIATNEITNLTAITDVKNIIRYHFQDSLALQHYVSLDTISCIADVGTGAGFPALPLKIQFPHLRVVLIEVNQKKVSFLQEVARALNLSDIEYYTDDWRTFLRKTEYAIDLFCSRASLAPEELIRMFQPSCRYKEGRMVYWGSIHWEASSKVTPFLQQEKQYTIENRKGKLVFLENKNKTQESNS
ncbi:MAG: 16S rRNA (guanine(527)-N(7))-methyltransferase RsmG [Candidatus Babeliales bacterium]